MIEVSLAVCWHYSNTKNFEIFRKKREREWSAKDRERERLSFFFLNEKVENLGVIFLKPSLSIYSIPLGLGLNYLALK